MLKTTLQQVLDNFPIEVDLHEFISEIGLRQKIEEGERQIANGEVLTHEQVRERLSAFLT